MSQIFPKYAMYFFEQSAYAYIDNQSIAVPTALSVMSWLMVNGYYPCTPPLYQLCGGITYNQMSFTVVSTGWNSNWAFDFIFSRLYGRVWFTDNSNIILDIGCCSIVPGQWGFVFFGFDTVQQQMAGYNSFVNYWDFAVISTSLPVRQTTNTVVIGGGDATSAGNMFMYNVLIYNRLLSTSEVLYNMNNSDNPITSGLIAWYKADPLYITSVGGKLIWVDVSGNGNNAILVGGYLVSLLQPLKPFGDYVNKTAVLISNNTATGPYGWQLPQLNIVTNPYGGAAGTYGLLNASAINNGAVSVVSWVYIPPGGKGTILGFTNTQYGTTPSGYVPWLYIGSDGLIRVCDYSGGSAQCVTSQYAPTNWHMIVAEEYISGSTYYIALYLDAGLMGLLITTSLPALFGYGGPYPYNYIAAGYTSSAYPQTPGGWYWFNGNISYLAIYNRALSNSEIKTIYEGTRITTGLVAEYIGDNYNPSTGVWLDTSGNNYNVSSITSSYAPRGCLTWPSTWAVGPSGNWMNWPTC